MQVKGDGCDRGSWDPFLPQPDRWASSGGRHFLTALSILKLRDEGTLSLDAPAETYVPELRGWKYPTDDSPKIRVRELLED